MANLTETTVFSDPADVLLLYLLLIVSSTFQKRLRSCRCLGDSTASLINNSVAELFVSIFHLFKAGIADTMSSFKHDLKKILFDNK